MPEVGTGVLYQVVVTGLSSGITTKNIFWYFVTTPVEPAADVATAFISKVSTAWKNLVSLNWTGNLLEVDEVTSVSNFSEETITFLGTVVGESLPVFDAFSITLSRATKETRSGRKRLTGVAESAQSSGNLVAAAQTDLETLKDAFVDDLVVNGTTIEPVIVRKTFVTPPTIPPTLNPPEDWIYNPLAGGVASSKVTTQNSRKS